MQTLQTNGIHNYRTATSDLGYDYIFLKDYCSARAGAILDTDGNLRWVGTAQEGVQAQAIVQGNTEVYESDGQTGLNRIDINTGLVTKTVDFKGYNNVAWGYDTRQTPVLASGTNDHLINVGKNGQLIVGVDTITNGITQVGTQFVVTDGTQPLGFIDMGNVITQAMKAGGDSLHVSSFVLSGQDWFHQNSAVYNPSDNTLVVSSRENFVIAIDYDPPADGSARKIHWILGDETKNWYKFQSLRKYALQLESNQDSPPIGQHGVQINSDGTLSLVSDGLDSQVEMPPGIQSNLSYGYKYRLDLNPAGSSTPGGATIVFGYGGYGGGSSFDSQICGSAYDFHATSGDTYLMDFADEAKANSTFPNAPSAYFAQVQGLKTNEQLVFDMELPDTGSRDCSGGWNAVPVDLSALYYNQ